MGSDQLIMSFSTLCKYLIPFFGVCLLIALILLIVNIIKTLKKLNTTLTKVNKIIDNADKKVDKLEKPLDTINNLSETVDHVHEASKTAVDSAAAMVISNMGNIKDWVQTKVDTVNPKPEVIEEDQING